MAVRLDVTHPELPTWRISSFKTSVAPQPLQPRAGATAVPESEAHGLESAARPDLPLLELLCELTAVSGFQNPVRVARNHDSQGETRVSAPSVSRPLTRLGSDSFSVRNGVFETLEVALTAWLRTRREHGLRRAGRGRARCLAGLGGEGDAFHWRTNPPQARANQYEIIDRAIPNRIGSG